MLAVTLALPFILVRLACSGLAALGHDHDFNLIDGSVALMFVMSVLMEFAVVFIYLLVGAKTESTPVTQTRAVRGRESSPAFHIPLGIRGRALSEAWLV